MQSLQSDCDHLSNCKIRRETLWRAREGEPIIGSGGRPPAESRGRAPGHGAEGEGYFASVVWTLDRPVQS